MSEFLESARELERELIEFTSTLKAAPDKETYNELIDGAKKRLDHFKL